MPIFYPDVLDQGTKPRTFSYGDKDVMLYALGIGLGADPMDEAELAFVYEKNLKIVPTAATVLAAANNRAAEGRTLGAWDKGKDKGAVVVNETTWTNEKGEKAATLTMSMFYRADGGFGGPTEGQPEPHPTPSRAPDLSVDVATRPDQALLYRLNGDRNPLHSDPESAKRSGFPRPILHGLCTYGLTCRAVLASVLDYDADAILSHQVRFSAPTFPGETVSVDIWKDGKDISFEARVKARNVTVIRNGLTRLR